MSKIPILKPDPKVPEHYKNCKENADLTTVNSHGILSNMDEFKRSVQPWFTTPTTEELKSSEIKIGRENNALENEFNYYLERASIDLGIIPPKLRIIPIELGYLAYNEEVNLLFAPLEIIEIDNDLFQTPIRKQIIVKSNKQKLLYLFLHEIGHAWHHQKHKNHWKKFEKNYKHMGWCSLEEYMGQQAERIADKIAVILFKRYGL